MENTQTVVELNGKAVFTGHCPYCDDTQFHHTSRARLVRLFHKHLKANHEFKHIKRHC